MHGSRLNTRLCKNDTRKYGFHFHTRYGFHFHSLYTLYQGVSLALHCLSFDFVGTCLDESSEEVGTIQVPSAWRPAIVKPSTPLLFLDVYARSSPPQSSMALECLVRGVCCGTLDACR